MTRNSSESAPSPAAGPPSHPPGIPHGRGDAVEAVVVATRKRVADGLPAPPFGSEPAGFLVALRGGRQA